MAKSAKSGAKSVDFSPVGKGIGDGMSAGFDGQSLITKVKKAVETAKAEAKKAGDIHSPSRWFRQVIGQNIGKGMALGVDDEVDNVVSSMHGIIESAKRTTQDSQAALLFGSGKKEVQVTTKDGTASLIAQALKDFVTTHQTVVLDTGETIGGIGPGMNEFLGHTTRKDERDSW